MTKTISRSAFVAALLALTAGQLAAQSPPPAPAPAAAPALQRPTAAPPPSTVAPAATPAATRATPVAAAPVAPVASASRPADSVRPAGAPSAERPAGAVAQCVDGTFVARTADCTARRGVRVRFPVERSGPPPVAEQPQAVPVGRPAVASSATPPQGATARCKDGTFVLGAWSAGRCDANGGLAAVLPATRTPPPPPPRRQ